MNPQASPRLTASASASLDNGGGTMPRNALRPEPIAVLLPSTPDAVMTAARILTETKLSNSIRNCEGQWEESLCPAGVYARA
jgi:hypothetical protein